MDGLRPRANSVLDEIQKMFEGGIQASPISTSTQAQMQRGTQFGGPQMAMGMIDNQPTRATVVPVGDGFTAALQSPAPVRPSMLTTPQIPTTRINPPKVTPARQIPDMGGAGVRMTPEQLAEQAAKAKEMEEVRPELKTDPDFQERLSGFFGNRENMLRLAAGFNSMRLNPDQGLATIINQELTDIRAKKTQAEERNRTAEYFDTVDPNISAAIRNGLSAKDAITLFREQQTGVVVGKMIVNPTTGAIIYDGSQEGSELPATFRALKLRAEEAGLEPGTEAYQQFMINGGQRAGMQLRIRPDGTVEMSEGGAGLKALTEGQGKATQFAERMSASQRVLNTVESEGTDIYNAIASNIPFAGNLLTSPEYKLYDQAKRDFINAILRYESGAAIGKAEFESADRQYFPQPGDTPEVIDQKRRNRDLAIATMQAVSGPQAQQYSENIRVQLFGPEAANWPDVGTIIDDPDNPGTKLKYRGGDPNIDSNWEVQ